MEPFSGRELGGGWKSQSLIKEGGKNLEEKMPCLEPGEPDAGGEGEDWRTGRKQLCLRLASGERLFFGPLTPHQSLILPEGSTNPLTTTHRVTQKSAKTDLQAHVFNWVFQAREWDPLQVGQSSGSLPLGLCSRHGLS